MSIASGLVQHDYPKITGAIDHLLKIARSATPDTDVQFRSHACGNDSVRDFLRDVLALANASVEGNRYIVVGVDFDDKGREQKYRVGVFELADCQDRPYMMRADFDERLRRGDAYKRIIDASLSMTLPNHNAFYIADRPPKRFVNERYVDRSPDEIAAYPGVVLRVDAIQIVVKIGDLPPGEPTSVFTSPPLVCVGSDLRGRRFGIRCALNGQNLHAPARGQLKLRFS